MGGAQNRDQRNRRQSRRFRDRLEVRGQPVRRRPPSLFDGVTFRADLLHPMGDLLSVRRPAAMISINSSYEGPTFALRSETSRAALVARLQHRARHDVPSPLPATVPCDRGMRGALGQASNPHPRNALPQRRRLPPLKCRARPSWAWAIMTASRRIARSGRSRSTSCG
jgi:hypothetical protein